MIYSVLLSLVLTLIIFLNPVHPVLSQENSSNSARPQFQQENRFEFVSPSPSPSPTVSPSPSPTASPLVNESSQVSSSSSQEASSTAQSPTSSQNNNPQGQSQSDGNIFIANDPSPMATPTISTPVPTPSDIAQPIAEPELITPLRIENPSPEPSPSPPPPLAVQVTRSITPPDFGSLFNPNQVQYYAEHDLPVNLTISLIFLSLALTLSGVLVLSESFSFGGLWRYIRNREWQEEELPYYSMKDAIS